MQILQILLFVCATVLAKTKRVAQKTDPWLGVDEDDVEEEVVQWGAAPVSIAAAMQDEAEAPSPPPPVVAQPAAIPVGLPVEVLGTEVETQPSFWGEPLLSRGVTIVPVGVQMLCCPDVVYKDLGDGACSCDGKRSYSTSTRYNLNLPQAKSICTDNVDCIGFNFGEEGENGMPQEVNFMWKGGASRGKSFCDSEDAPSQTIDKDRFRCWAKDATCQATIKKSASEDIPLLGKTLGEEWSVEDFMRASGWSSDLKVSAVNSSGLSAVLMDKAAPNGCPAISSAEGVKPEDWLTGNVKLDGLNVPKANKASHCFRSTYSRGLHRTCELLCMHQGKEQLCSTLVRGR